jgi:hypothetical protein
VCRELCPEVKLEGTVGFFVLNCRKRTKQIVSLWWIPNPKKPWISKPKIKTMFICFLDIRGIIQFEFVSEGTTVNQKLYVEVLYWCREAQARRVVERSLIDSSPWQRAGIFSALCVAVSSKRRHFCHRPFTVLSWLASTWLLAVSRTQECPERKAFLGRWEH